MTPVPNPTDRASSGRLSEAPPPRRSTPCAYARASATVLRTRENRACAMRDERQRAAGTGVAAARAVRRSAEVRAIRGGRPQMWVTPGAASSPRLGGGQSQKLGDRCRRPRCTVGLDGVVVDVAADLGGDRGGDLLGPVEFEVHAPSGAVALEAVADVEVLLEVVAKREVEERSLVGGQLHRGGESALNDGEVAGGEVAVEVMHVGAHLESFGAREARGVDPRSRDDDHPQLGTE